MTDIRTYFYRTKKKQKHRTFLDPRKPPEHPGLRVPFFLMPTPGVDIDVGRKSAVRMTMAPYVFLDLRPPIRSSLVAYFRRNPTRCFESVSLDSALRTGLPRFEHRQAVVLDLLEQDRRIRLFLAWIRDVPTLQSQTTFCREILKKCYSLYSTTDSIHEVDSFYAFMHDTDIQLDPLCPQKTLFAHPVTTLLSLPSAVRVWETLQRPLLTSDDLYQTGFLLYLYKRLSVNITAQVLDRYGTSRLVWAHEVTLGLLQTKDSFRHFQTPTLRYEALYQNVLLWLPRSLGTQSLLTDAIHQQNDRIYVSCWERLQSEVIDLMAKYVGKLDQSVPPSPVAVKVCCICLEEVVPGGGLRLDCGHVFDRECIQKWSSLQKTCPLCRALFTLRAEMPSQWDEWIQLFPQNLNPQQMRAARNCVRSNCSVITGAGGTGKTEVVSVVVRYISWLFREQVLQARPVCLAPSGKAAEVLKRRLGSDGEACDISTIHSWILRPKAACIPTLFLDESSMAGLWITWHLLQCAKNAGVQSIILLGDPHQLPPVDHPGSLLDAVVAIGEPLVTVLSTNYRAATGLLGLLTHLRSVADHTQPRVQPEWFETPNSVLEILPNNSVDALHSTLLRHLQNSEPSSTRIIVSQKRPLIWASVLARPPEHSEFFRGLCQYYNPVPNREPGDFYVGDLVRSTTNVVASKSEPSGDSPGTLLVSNGSEGMILSVSPLVVKFAGRSWTQGPTNTAGIQKLFETLEWGMLSTVHKFQGSEAPTIVAVFLGTFVDHLTIQLLYTAASRAQSQLVLLIEQQTFDLYQTTPGHVGRNRHFMHRLLGRLTTL